MTFYEFEEKIFDFNDKAILENWQNILKHLAKIEDPLIIKDLIMAMADDLSILESDDFFGTEGMRL